MSVATSAEVVLHEGASPRYLSTCQSPVSPLWGPGGTGTSAERWAARGAARGPRDETREGGGTHMLGRLARDRRPLEARVLGLSFDCRKQLLDLGVCNEKVQLLDDLHLGICPGSGGVRPPKCTPCASPLVTAIPFLSFLPPFQFVAKSLHATGHFFEALPSAWRVVGSGQSNSVCPGTYPWPRFDSPAWAAPVSRALSLAPPAGVSKTWLRASLLHPCRPLHAAVEGVHMRTCYALEWLLLPAHRCLHFLLTAHSRMQAGRLLGVSSTKCV
jgi:hypothetical protein